MVGILLGDNLYDLATDEERLAAEYIHKVFVKAGKPRKLEGESAWKVMDAIMQIWGGLYPYEFGAFKKSLIEDQRVERSVHEANKEEGGYFPISYPTRLLSMMKVYFTNDRFQDHSLIKKMVNRYPILKRTKWEI